MRVVCFWLGTRTSPTPLFSLPPINSSHRQRPSWPSSINPESFKGRPVRIDADEIREWIPDHKSTDAQVYQKACTDGVNKLYDHVIGKRLNVIMDGTFAYAYAVENVERSLRHKRLVEIYYIYQDPFDSWTFTKDREVIEHRNVPKEVFIKAFFSSQANVERVKAKFGDRVVLNVVVKNFARDSGSLELNVAGIEKYLPKRYTGEELARILP